MSEETEPINELEKLRELVESLRKENESLKNRLSGYNGIGTAVLDGDKATIVVPLVYPRDSSRRVTLTAEKLGVAITVNSFPSGVTDEMKKLPLRLSAVVYFAKPKPEDEGDE